ncbi:MAG: HAMP domain-containing histidine kinase [Bacilli bacterium]|jgi:signal transduction histidine kinase|nr:HAMP domain-containing histidine kinase [Bacilli bacterium]
MKIHSRFFITFFCFALFFSLSSYLAQDSIFKHSQDKEIARVDNEINVVKNLVDKPDELNRFLTENDIILDVVYTENNQVKFNYHDNLINNVNSDILSRYKNVSDVTKECAYLNNLPNQSLREKPGTFDANYIIQSFCHNNKIYYITSHYTEYNDAYNLLKQSYFLIITGTVIISAILSYILARYISTPITQINFMTKKLSNLDFSQKLNIAGNDEIAELATNINILSDKLKHSIDKLKDNIIKEKEASDHQIQLFASMSHELKTPITILFGILEGIKNKVGPYKEPLNYVDDMIDEVNNMQNIVMSLLNYAKFSVQEMEIKLKPYDLEDLICENVNRLNTLIDEKHINIETNIIDDVVLVDRTSIDLVLKNVLENAIYYTEENSKVEIFTSSFTDYVLIQIYNHGTNIDSESLNHIFEPFYRSDKSRLDYKHGTGLGLTIVKQILERYGSNYSMYNVNTEDEYAVCFEFTLKKDITKDDK